jgi:hypothetical protein
LKKRIPDTVPKVSLVNLTPTSIGEASLLSGAIGAVFGPQSEHGQFTLTVTPGLGVWRLPLSSTARHLIVADGLPWAIHV